MWCVDGDGGSLSEKRTRREGRGVLERGCVEVRRGLRRGEAERRLGRDPWRRPVGVFERDLEVEGVLGCVWGRRSVDRGRRALLGRITVWVVDEGGRVVCPREVLLSRRYSVDVESVPEVQGTLST